MARFDYAKFIEMRCEDYLYLRELAYKEKQPSQGFKIAWGECNKCANSVENALSNEILFMLKKAGVDINLEAPLKLIDLNNESSCPD